MADALISAEHFYVNASFYNDTDTEQDAIIHVTDNDDIINRDDSWLVHITRFSCDSMGTLAYIERDDSATWQILCYNEHQECVERFDFVLAKNYATPADLIDDMNFKSRFKKSPDVQYEEYHELYRFELDAGGRFRLLAAPSEKAMEHHYVTYEGSASMNKLLGFSDASPFLRFAPAVGTQFARCVDFLYAECLKTEGVHFWDGSYYRDLNNCLVYLLNGLSMEARMINGVESVTSHYTYPNTEVAGFAAGIDLIDQYVHNKGTNPSQHNGENEACIPKGGVPMICEWSDVQGAAHPCDNGMKSTVKTLHWDVAYNQGVVAGGQVTFRDVLNQGNLQAATRWPVFNPNDNSWTNTRYAYPFDSIMGYQYAGQVGALIQVASIPDRRTITLTAPFGPKVEVGDDLWIMSPDSPNAADPYCHVFQIQSIDSTGLIIGLVDLIGDLAAAAGATSIIGLDVVATDRRVPFQSRSRTFDGLDSWYAVDHGDQQRTTIIMSKRHNGDVGDQIYFVHGRPGWGVPNTLALGPFTIYSVQNDMHEFSYIGLAPGPFQGGLLINNSVTQVFIKKATDAVRWAKDAANMKMAAPTFSYEDKIFRSCEVVDRIRGYKVNYGSRNVQVYDENRLDKQVVRFNAEIQFSTSFKDSNTTNHEYISEEIDGSHFLDIPPTAEIVTPARVGGENHNDFLDLGLFPIQHPHGLHNEILSHFSRGTHPVALVSRRTNPLWAIRAPDVWVYQGQEVVDFLKASPNELPLLNIIGTGPGYSQVPTNLVLIGGVSPGLASDHVSLLVVGVRTSPLFERDHFLFWSPDTIPNPGGAVDSTIIRHQVLVAMAGAINRGNIDIIYNKRSQGYAIVKKEMSGTTITAGKPCRLFGFGGDHISSALDSQIDHIFPYRQLIITSDDLQQIPERSQDAASRQPILSSYTLSTMIATSIDAKGNPSGGSSQAFGTVYFSESGARRYHHLIKVGGGMRQFRLHAALTYKDHNKSSKAVRLAPGGQFTAQLLFMKKEEV